MVGLAPHHWLRLWGVCGSRCSFAVSFSGKFFLSVSRFQSGSQGLMQGNPPQLKLYLPSCVCEEALCAGSSSSFSCSSRS